MTDFVSEAEIEKILKTGQKDEITKLTTKFIEICAKLPENEEAHYLLAKLLFHEEKYIDSIKEAKILLNKNQKSEKYALLLAEIYESISEYSESLRILEPFTNSSENLLIKDAYKRIQESQKECVNLPSDPKERSEYLEYYAWLKRCGISAPKLDLQYFNNSYRGLIAKQNIHIGDEILTVPLDCMITIKSVMENGFGEKIKKSGISLIYPNNTYFALFIIEESYKADSKWKYLIQSMPKSVDNFPVYYKENELKYLDASFFIEEIRIFKEDIKTDYDRVCKIIPELSKMATLDDFMRTRCLVNSRIFGTFINDQENDSIIPFADMFNYSRLTSMTKWYFDDTKKCFVVISNEEINRKNEVYLSYGHKANYSFLLFYGFTVENNINDFTILPVYLKQDDSMRKLKDKLIETSCAPRKCKIGYNEENNRFYKTISYLRFVEYEGPPEFLQKLYDEFCKKGTKEKPVFYKGTNLPPISLENEINALKRLKDICKDLLFDYKTSAQEDEIYLLKNKEKISFNELNCVRYRMAEKQILEFYEKFANLTIGWLKNKKITAKMSELLKDARFTNYFKDIEKLKNSL